MIRRTLEVLKSELQYFMDLKDPDNLASSSVVISNILNQDGKTVFNESDTDSSDHFLIMTLVNIAQDTHRKPPAKLKEISGQKLGKVNPEINLNLYVLFSADSSQYETALTMISNVIGFFQSKSYFDKDNTPSLPAAVEKVIADIQSMTFEQQNYLWGLLGAKYMPSVVYKLRTISIDEEQLTDISSPIQTINFLD